MVTFMNEYVKQSFDFMKFLIFMLIDVRIYLSNTSL